MNQSDEVAHLTEARRLDLLRLNSLSVTPNSLARKLQAARKAPNVMSAAAPNEL
jgi:hypothetical protein